MTTFREDLKGIRSYFLHAARIRPGGGLDKFAQRIEASHTGHAVLGGIDGLEPSIQIERISGEVISGVLAVSNQVAGQAVTQYAREPNYKISAALEAAANLGTLQKVEILDKVSEGLIAQIVQLHNENKTSGRQGGNFDRIQILTAAIVALHTESKIAQKLKEDHKEIGIKADQGIGAAERNLFGRIVENIEPMASALGTYLSTPEVVQDRVAGVAWLQKDEPQGLFGAKMLGYANTVLQQRFIQRGVRDPKEVQAFLRSFAIANEFHTLAEASGKQHSWELMIRMMQINPRLGAAFAMIVDPSLTKNRMEFKAIAQGIPLAGTVYDTENDLYLFTRTGAVAPDSVPKMLLAGGQFEDVQTMVQSFFGGRDNFVDLLGHTTSARARWILTQMYDERLGIFYPPLSSDEVTLARVVADVGVARFPDVEKAKELAAKTRVEGYSHRMIPKPKDELRNGRYFIQDILIEQAQVADVFAQASRLFLADRLSSLRDHLGEVDTQEAKKGSYYGATMIMMALALQEGMFPNPKAVEGLYGEFADMMIDVITGEKAASAQVKRAAEFTLQALVPLFPESQALALIDRYEERVIQNPAILGSFGRFSHALAIHTDSTLPAAKNEQRGVRPAIAERLGRLTQYLVENYRNLTGQGIVKTVLLDPAYNPSNGAERIPAIRVAGGALDGVASPLYHADIFARELQRRGHGTLFQENRVIMGRQIQQELREELLYGLTIDGLRGKIEKCNRAKDIALGVGTAVQEMRDLVDAVFPFMADVAAPNIGGLVQEIKEAFTDAELTSLIPQMPEQFTQAIDEAERAVTTWDERMRQLNQIPTAKGRYKVIFEGVQGMLDAIYAHLPQTHVSGGGLGRSTAILNFPQPGEYTELVDELLQSGSAETKAFIEYLTQTGELDIQKVQNGIAVTALDILRRNITGAVDINNAIVQAQVTLADERITALNQVLELFKRSRSAGVKLSETTVRLFEAKAERQKTQIEADIVAMQREWQKQIDHTNTVRTEALAEVRSADTAVKTQRTAILKQIDDAASPEGPYAKAVNGVLGALNNPDLVGGIAPAVISWIRYPSPDELEGIVEKAIGVNLRTLQLTN